LVDFNYFEFIIDNMTNKIYNKDTLEAVTQGSVVGGNPSRIISLLKTTLLLLSLFLGGCASTDSFVKLGEPQNSFSADSKFAISRDEGHSQWSDRQKPAITDTYIGSGVNPNGGQNETGTQFPFGRTGWGSRPYEPNF
jgi:hypothetical protein